VPTVSAYTLRSIGEHVNNREDNHDLDKQVVLRVCALHVPYQKAKTPIFLSVKVSWSCTEKFPDVLSQDPNAFTAEHGKRRYEICYQKNRKLQGRCVIRAVQEDKEESLRKDQQPVNKSEISEYRLPGL
jgi:hypothetical protein